MTIQIISGDFTVCQVRDFSQVNWNAAYCFTGKTDEENSLVCLTEDVPAGTTAREDGWRAFRIQGTLDFSLVGILARISTLLAQSGIAIFALSTYKTDYVLTKAADFPHALAILRDAGYQIESKEE